jgi:hypothetical protein
MVMTESPTGDVEISSQFEPDLLLISSDFIVKLGGDLEGHTEAFISCRTSLKLRIKYSILKEQKKSSYWMRAYAYFQESIRLKLI